MPTTKTLVKYLDYSRLDVHNIFSPFSTFTPQAGTWGIQGIIPVPNRNGDYIFFVTYGQQQGTHVFDEGVTNDGILTWQSQPRQSFESPIIQQFIHHNEIVNSIYLFLRTGRDKEYTYLGKLKYISHDKNRENPVYFKWQILDWNPESALTKIKLKLRPGYTQSNSSNLSENTLEIVTVPQHSTREGKPTDSFRTFSKPDYSQIDENNRELGLKGEELVIRYEKQKLIEAGRNDLASKVFHTSVYLGDGFGYDIESYDQDGRKKYIEVKTTKGDKQTSFFISSNEKNFAESHQGNYFLYRVFEFDEKCNSGKCFILTGLDTLSLTPIQFIVTF